MFIALVVGVTIIALIKMWQKKQLEQLAQTPGDHAEAVFRKAYQAHQEAVREREAVEMIQTVVSSKVAPTVEPPAAPAAVASAPATRAKRTTTTKRRR